MSRSETYLQGVGLTTHGLEHAQQRARYWAAQLRPLFEWVDGLQNLKNVQPRGITTEWGGILFLGYKKSKTTPTQDIDPVTRQVRAGSLMVDIPFPHHFGLSMVTYEGLTEAELAMAESVFLMIAAELGAPNTRCLEHHNTFARAREACSLRADKRSVSFGSISISWEHQMRRTSVDQIIRDRLD